MVHQILVRLKCIKSKLKNMNLNFQRSITT